MASAGTMNQQRVNKRRQAVAFHLLAFQSLASIICVMSTHLAVLPGHSGPSGRGRAIMDQNGSGHRRFSMS